MPDCSYTQVWWIVMRETLRKQWQFFQTCQINWWVTISLSFCVLENHLCVAAAAAVLRRRVSTNTKSQRLCASGFMAQIWCFHRINCCCATCWYQLLFLEEDTQVRWWALHFVWCLLRRLYVKIVNKNRSIPKTKLVIYNMIHLQVAV